MFSGQIRKLKYYQLELNIDSTVQLVVQNFRPTPLHYPAKVGAKLKQLEDQDIIEQVTGPTPWVLPLVVVDKLNGDIRLCVNMCKPNEALCHTHHPYPTSEEILQDLNGSKFFSKTDLRECYHQIELAESSRHLTTFKTHVGLCCYKRLPYGASVGSEICQHVIGQVLEGCHNVKNFADDILVHGTTKEDHDRSPENVLLRPQEKSLTVHPTKYLFGIMELDYYGSHLSTRCIPRQGLYTRKQAHAAAQHSHGSKKLSGISKHCRLFPSIPSCYDRADMKDHTQRLSMVIGPRAI